MANIKEITLADIKAAYERISPHAEKTPVLESKTINKEHGKQYFFKCENMQTTGSFKFRGAMNAALQILSKGTGNVKGLITHTSGNHGQGVAFAAKIFKLPCVTVVGRGTAQYKIDAMKQLGAEVIMCELSAEGREKTFNDIQKQRGYHYIHAYDDYDVIAGQATIGYEFLNQVPDLDAIVVCIGAGSMAAGVCLAAKHMKPNCKVFGVEAQGKDLEKCLKAGQRLWPNPPQYLDTICEGMRNQQVSPKNWPILLETLQRQVLTVSDEDAMRGMQYACKKLKVVIEANAGATVDAALSSKLKQVEGLNKIGVVLCGGNLEIDKFATYVKGI